LAFISELSHQNCVAHALQRHVEAVVLVDWISYYSQVLKQTEQNKHEACKQAWWPFKEWDQNP